MNRLSTNPRLLLVAALVGALCVAAGAQGHVKFSNDAWVFRGETWNDPDSTHQIDPVNIIFKGGNRIYNKDTVNDKIGQYAGWGGAGCGSRQRMIWRAAGGGNTTSDKDDTQRASGGCVAGHRYHFRGWDDQEHDLWTAGHGRRDQWFVGGVHHEKIVATGSCIPTCIVTGFRHDIDMDWDIARRKMIDKMAGLCSWPRWKRHPQARGLFGDRFRSSGWIGRISFNQSQDGC